jgi:hypothetical protein
MPKGPDIEERKEAAKATMSDDIELEMIKENIKLMEEFKNKLGEKINKLTRVEASIEQNLNDYSIARDDFEKRRDLHQKYYDAKEAMIETVLKTQKATIDKEINAYDTKITNIQNDIVTGENVDLPKLMADYYAAVKDCKTKHHQCQKLRNKIKNYKTSMEEKLAKLDMEKEKIDQLDDTTDAPEIYGILTEYKRTLGKIDLETPEDFAKDFYLMWSEFNDKDNEVQDKKQAREIKIEEIRDKERICRKLNKERLAEILKRIANIPKSQVC